MEGEPCDSPDVPVTTPVVCELLAGNGGGSLATPRTNLGQSPAEVVGVTVVTPICFLTIMAGRRVDRSCAGGTLPDSYFGRNADYTLRWPRELFAEEAGLLVRRGSQMGTGPDWTSEVTLLLQEAFVSKVPAADFKKVVQTNPGHGCRAFLIHL